MNGLRYIGSRPGVQGGGGDVAVATIGAIADITGTDPTRDIILTNTSPDLPAGAQLEFSPAYLEAVTYDDGTADAPVVGIEPGGARSVTVQRTASAPTGGGAVVVTVTATFADGSTASKAVSLYPASMLKDVVMPLGPTHLWLMTDNGSGLAEDLGSSPVDAAVYGVTLDASSKTGWSGEIDCNGSNDRIYASLPRTGAGGCGDSQVRSWLFGYETKGIGTARNGMGDTQVLRVRQSGSDQLLYYAGGSNFTTGTVQSHTDAGASEKLENAAGKVCIVLYSYDPNVGGGTWTFRWKQTGHRAGHSVHTITGKAVDPTTGNLNWKMGWDGNSAPYLYGGLMAIFDSVLTEANFNDIAAVAGL